jgi:hypothetical protein
MIDPEYYVTEVKVENTYHYLLVSKVSFRYNSDKPLTKNELINMSKQELKSLSLTPYIPAPLENGK